MLMIRGEMVAESEGDGTISSLKVERSHMHSIEDQVAGMTIPLLLSTDLHPL